MGIHRGSTIYIPIIVPENWQLTASLLFGLVGLVLIIISLTTNQWSVSTMHVPEGTYHRETDVTVAWGLRAVHIQWCERRFFRQQDATFVCASEDIHYRDCSPESDWCSSSADPIIAFSLIVAAACGLVLSTAVALSRRIFQPVGYALCTISCSVAIIIFRACQLSFTPSNILEQWSKEADKKSSVQGFSYFVMTAGTVALLGGMVMASWGTYRISRRHPQEEGPQNGGGGEGTGAAGAGANGTTNANGGATTAAVQIVGDEAGTVSQANRASAAGGAGVRRSAQDVADDQPDFDQLNEPAPGAVGKKSAAAAAAANGKVNKSSPNPRLALAALGAAAGDAVLEQGPVAAAAAARVASPPPAGSPVKTNGASPSASPSVASASPANGSRRTAAPSESPSPQQQGQPNVQSSAATTAAAPPQDGAVVQTTETST